MRNLKDEILKIIISIIFSGVMVLILMIFIYPMMMMLKIMPDKDILFNSLLISYFIMTFILSVIVYQESNWHNK